MPNVQLHTRVILVSEALQLQSVISRDIQYRHCNAV